MKVMNLFFSSSPVLLYQGIAIVRIILGMLLIYHGIEIFNPELMNGYLENGMFKAPSAKFLVYSGKASELIIGILFLFGFLTRVAAVMMMGTFSYITFIVGQGRFWYEEQHPFMFALFGLLFFFIGPGDWNIERIILREKNNNPKGNNRPFEDF